MITGLEMPALQPPHHSHSKGSFALWNTVNQPSFVSPGVTILLARICSPAIIGSGDFTHLIKSDSA